MTLVPGPPPRGVNPHKSSQVPREKGSSGLCFSLSQALLKKYEIWGLQRDSEKFRAPRSQPPLLSHSFEATTVIKVTPGLSAWP